VAKLGWCTQDGFGGAEPPRIPPEAPCTSSPLSYPFLLGIGGGGAPPDVQARKWERDRGRKGETGEKGETGAKRMLGTQMARVGFEPTPSLEDQQTRCSEAPEAGALDRSAI
jgi:hypothetical protein